VKLAIVAALAFVATPAFAQKAAVSAFLTNPAYGSSDSAGGRYSGAWGVGAEVWFGPHVSAVVDVSQQKVYETDYFTAVPTTTSRSLHPIDALVRYRFAGGERWKPYIGGGIRAVHGYAYDIVFSHGPASWNVSPEVNGGVTFLFTKQLGLDFDVKAVNSSQDTGIDDLRGSIGLSWRF
jgi:opacity protein-like surface antigen